MPISICLGCHEPLGRSNFRSNRTRGTGHGSLCRDCENQARGKRRHQAKVRQVLAEFETFQRTRKKETARALCQDSA
jgi:hypothetical protein